MSKIEISKATHKVFGNCVRMTNGLVELWVTVDFGPRVIHFSRAGMDNMLYEDVSMSVLGEPQAVYNGEVFKLYGGHRLWISPEILPRCYFPDTRPVKCVEVENGMAFIAPVEEINGIQKSITITLEEDEPEVTLEHRIQNCGQWEVEFAPWALTIMAAGAVEVIPMPKRQTGLLPNRNIVLWDYAAMNDPRVYWGKDYITLRQDASNPQPFKLGLNNEDGWCAVFNKGQAFFKFFNPVDDEIYPDGGCCFESYTNDKILEAETLGALEYVSPGEWVVHVEEWSIYEAAVAPSDDEDEITRAVSKYID